MKKWQLYEAKNKLSQIIDEVMDGSMQVVTKRGIDAVVIISANDFKNLLEPKKKFTEFLTGDPKIDNFEIERVKGSIRLDDL